MSGLEYHLRDGKAIFILQSALPSENLTSLWANFWKGHFGQNQGNRGHGLSVIPGLIFNNTGGSSNVFNTLSVECFLEVPVSKCSNIVFTVTPSPRPTQTKQHVIPTRASLLRKCKGEQGWIYLLQNLLRVAVQYNPPTVWPTNIIRRSWMIHVHVSLQCDTMKWMHLHSQPSYCLTIQYQPLWFWMIDKANNLYDTMW